MNIRFIIYLILIGLLGSSGCSNDSPSKTVIEFYNLYLKLRPSGLPTQEEEKTMSPYLSERLIRLIDRARSYQKSYMHDHPKNKPPWADGCLFTSVFEGPTQFEIKNVIGNEDKTSIVVVKFKDETTEWEDSLIIRKESNKFVIDDFVMSGAGPFNPPWTFSEGLKIPDK